MLDYTFQISYPKMSSGTDKSIISFFDGNPDINSLFYSSPRSKRYFFITDATVASLPCMSQFLSKFDDGVYEKDNLLVLGSGEPYKTIDTVLQIISAAVEAGYTRNDVFVGIGGGVICDLTAFAASIFKRGIEVQFVPTTLLSMVDAAIGGKSGCDFDNYKNIIGSFYPASNIYYFPEFVLTLPENQFNSGLAEALKTALLFDKELYDCFKTQSEKINSRDMTILKEIIKKCVQAKAKIVEEDLTEQGIRATLNLGHTFGHAFETIVGLGTVTHGSAVAWGISRSVELAYKKDYCREAFKSEIFEVLKLYGWETKGIPSAIKGGGIGERFINVMHKDKKNLNDKIRVIILKDNQDTVIEEVSDKDILSVLK